MALAIAARTAGHEIVAVVGRDRAHAERAAATLDTPARGIEESFPSADVAVIAVRDGAIGAVAELLAGTDQSFPLAVHLSGLVGVDALAPLADRGIATGSFHPLQTLPTPELGAQRLGGAGVAITAEGDAADTLRLLAESLGAVPFDLDDAAKPLYHAAAAAASNFPVATLAMAQDMFAAAGVDFAVARPLVEAIVANSFLLGPRAALTGPVARGDVSTVRAQLEAVVAHTPEWEPAFRGLVDELARLSGRRDLFEDLTGGGR